MVHLWDSIVSFMLNVVLFLRVQLQHMCGITFWPLTYKDVSLTEWGLYLQCKDINICCKCLPICLSRKKMRNNARARMEGSAGPGHKANGPIEPPSNVVSPPMAPDELDDEPQSSLTDVTQMWIKFAKTFAIIFPIYILGYFEFSFSWVLIGLAMLFYWRKNHGHKDYRINRALAFLDHEDKTARQSVQTSELPPWVSTQVFLLSSLPCHSCFVFWLCFKASTFPWVQPTSCIGCQQGIACQIDWHTSYMYFLAKIQLEFALTLFSFSFSSQTLTREHLSTHPSAREVFRWGQKHAPGRVSDRFWEHGAHFLMWMWKESFWEKCSWQQHRWN